MDLPEPDIRRREGSRSPRLPIGARRLRFGAVWRPLSKAHLQPVGQSPTPMQHSITMFAQRIHSRMEDILTYEPWNPDDSPRPVDEIFWRLQYLVCGLQWLLDHVAEGGPASEIDKCCVKLGDILSGGGRRYKRLGRYALPPPAPTPTPVPLPAPAPALPAPTPAVEPVSRAPGFASARRATTTITTA
ncbi:unnamed protein product [Prorocentrum cordatum]|uniref:Peroxisomal membrane protein PEX16 n=1 Tax=Prorocentrum cordatum TaxID=2364126 RepID=A0ABN9V1D3_9DINO|nr:unnamed protein product [Polarella glacialis]